MAIIDEYKQAIQDVMDGRAPEPPKPSEFPDTDDKLAAQYFAAAAMEKAKEAAATSRFIVTLTPTAQDFSGTMDKTVAEINAAYEAGMEIVFRTMMSETTYMDVDCTARWFDGTTYPSFNGFILSDDAFIFAFTSATNDGTKQTYGTTIYALTPAS